MKVHAESQLIHSAGSAEAREKAAYETLDWIRLTDPPISSQQFDALVSVVEGLHKPALVVFFDFIIPGKSLVCGSEDLVPALQYGHFPSLIYHNQLTDLI